MREFMTKVSNYINEKKSSEKGDMLVLFILLGVALLIIAVIVVLIMVKGDKTQTAEVESIRMEEAYSENDDAEVLKVEYLSDIDRLDGKVSEISSLLSELRETVTRTEGTYLEDKEYYDTKVSELSDSITVVINTMEQYKTEISDLRDMCNVLSSESIPSIKNSINSLTGRIDETAGLISGLNSEIEKLKIADDNLKKEIDRNRSGLEKLVSDTKDELSTIIEKNNKETVERVQVLTKDGVAYKYDETTATVIFLPQ